jgi:hypothetical protein
VENFENLGNEVAIVKTIWLVKSRVLGMSLGSKINVNYVITILFSLFIEASDMLSCHFRSFQQSHTTVSQDSTPQIV